MIFESYATITNLFNGCNWSFLQSQGCMIIMAIAVLAINFDEIYVIGPAQYAFVFPAYAGYYACPVVYVSAF